MMIANRRLCTFGALFLSLTISSFAAFAQTAAVQTDADKFFGRFDLAVSGSGVFTTSTSGLNYLPQEVALSPSSTLGALVEVRYTATPHIGAQFNYSYARYTDNFTITNVHNSPNGALSSVLGVQTKATEYSLGYLGHLPDLFGLHTFVGAGGGILAFRPTSGGGLGLPQESRGVAYAAVGVEQNFSDHLGFRVQYRQIFFGAPDFNTNYLANGARSTTIEPSAGVFLRF